MNQTEWDSRQYLKFERERTQPPRDLANRIALNNPKRILDVGCGPGNSTQVLHERFPEAEILGVDSSFDMLEKAQKQYPAMNFQFFNVENSLAGLGQTWDVIFSNACIQWVPDHPRILRDMLSVLNPGGVIAIQIPETRNMPMYRILTELSDNSQWSSKIANIRNFYSLEMEEYYELLASLTSDFSIWETNYIQTVAGFDGLIEWYRGSGLRPYLAALSENEQPEFIEQVKTRLKDFYLLRPDGSVLMRFPRLFFTLTSN